MAASRKQADIIGFVFLATVTGIGGGTLRDLILGQAPVFWILDPKYILVSASVAIFGYFFAHYVEYRYRLLLWLDAVGLAAYCIIGAAKGLEITGSLVIATIAGMMTATFGGIIRDIITGEKSVVMKPEIYIAAAMVGSITFLLTANYLPQSTSALFGAGIAFLIRGGALVFGWRLPRYASRPGRSQN